MQFTEVFGRSPRVRLLEFLADHIDFDYTVSQLREFTGISRPTIYNLLKELGKEGMVAPTRVVGDSPFFKLNMDNQKVIAMLTADFERINKRLLAGEFEENHGAVIMSQIHKRPAHRALIKSHTRSKSALRGEARTGAKAARVAGKAGVATKGKKASTKGSPLRGGKARR